MGILLRKLILGILLLHLTVSDSQRLRHVTRIRKAYTSTTDSVNTIYATIVNYNMEHRLNGAINFTKDIAVNMLHVQVHRCEFEKTECEDFQLWKFPKDGLNEIVYMKNQMWTPLVYAIEPRVPFPHVKKGVYVLKNATLDAEATVKYYKDIVKYVWKITIILKDKQNRDKATLFFEFIIFEYVERKRKH